MHNDFTGEVPPKFEIFPDRIEITSAGGLPEGLSQEEFFLGFSVPRNKELIRVFKDLGMVEQLGSGVPRILESYGRECFTFSENFLRMVFPIQGGQASGQASGQAGGQAEQMTARRYRISLKTGYLGFMRMHYNLSKRQFTVIISQADLKLQFGYLKGLPIIRQAQLILGLF